jgi:hypothetical protein
MSDGPFVDRMAEVGAAMERTMARLEGFPREPPR